MSTAIFTRALRDRWIGTTVGAVSLGLLLLFAMAVYRDIDLAVYTDLPEALRDVMGIPGDADVASLAYGAMLGSVGALAFGGLAISIGAGSIAGEERNGTMGLLLGNPTSRHTVLASKALALIVLIAVSTTVLWAFADITPRVLDVDIGDANVPAIMVHLGMSTLLFGFLALAIGAWTGKSGLAVGASAGVMVLSFFAVGLLPLVDDLADLARIFPWYYYDGSDPLSNGIDVAHLAMLAAGIAIAAVVAWVGVQRRDLRGQSSGTSLIDRLRTMPVVSYVGERFAGSGRVSAIWAKTASDHQGLLAITALLMFAVMGLMMGPLYVFIEDDIAGLADDLPEAMLDIFGGGDLSTPEGWFQVETLGLVAPIAIILCTLVVARSLATRQADGTMGLLLANPVSRRRVVLETAAAMTLYAVIIGVATFSGIALGIILADLDVSIANLAAAITLLTLLGLLFGALTLLLAALTGRAAPATYITIGAAAVAQLWNGLLATNDDLADLARLSPFYYYISSDPLVTGMNWWHAGILGGVAVALVPAAVIAFDRNDLRRN